MTLPFKPHILALLCCAGLLAASGTLYVKSRAADTPPAPAPVAQPAPAPAAVATPDPAAAQPVASTFTSAQIDQWVAPIALYPDNLLSQVLMASTYPSNVLQAVQWSQDNPTMQGDPAVQAVANQPWDPSVKSLVAFPALLSLMGENPQWVQDLGNAFLAQPQDVMDSVQKLRTVAQQTGTLKSSPQQKVTTTQIAPAPQTETTASTATTSTTRSSTTTVVEPAPTTQIIKIESTDPNVVYVPTYNPNTVYGTWPNTSYPPVYLPPTPGQQFSNSYMNGLGYSLGVATTWALFSSIDWDDDHHHHDDDYYHHDGGYHGGGNNNININVNNYNHFTNQHLDGKNTNWQHNPTFRNNVPYPNNNVAQRFHQTNVPGGLSATQHAPGNLTNQRQAALDQFQQRTHNGAAAGLTAGGVAAVAGNRNSQREAASQQLNKITQRSNYRGYDTPQNRAAAKEKLQHPTAQQQQHRQDVKSRVQNPTAQQQQHRQEAKSRVQHPTAQQQQHREAAKSQVQQHRANVTPEQHQQRQQKAQNLRSNAFSGNESRSPSWEAQRQRGMQSRSSAHLNNNERAAVQQHVSQHRELRHR
jgi:hypothetical protein